jgi:hypothetical protein
MGVPTSTVMVGNTAHGSMMSTFMVKGMGMSSSTFMVGSMARTSVIFVLAPAVSLVFQQIAALYIPEALFAIG